MSLTRQQKRATLKALNNPKKLTEIMAKNRAKEERELVKYHKTKKTKRAQIAIITLVVGITLICIFG